MEELLSPFGLAAMAFLYYIARQEGTLTFKLSGYDGMIDDLIKIIYSEIEPVTNNMSFEERCKYRSKAVDKLREALSQRLSDGRFSRLKIHDLKKAIRNRISLLDRTSKQMDADEVVCECFKGMISSYDNKSKSW